jgi:hypothetical protein
MRIFLLFSCSELSVGFCSHSSVKLFPFHHFPLLIYLPCYVALNFPNSFISYSLINLFPFSPIVYLSLLGRHKTLFNDVEHGRKGAGLT